MTETEISINTRTTETIKIHVIRAKHLRGAKGDVVMSFAKVEFNGMLIGESSKVESSYFDHHAEYNFTTGFDCYLGEGGFCDVASNPVVITVTEVMAKEKKQKEEKQTILGQCTVDLLPLLLEAQCEIKISLKLHPVTTALLVGFTEDDEKPELDVCVSVNEPLLSEEQLTQNNLLVVKVGSAYSLPDLWMTNSNQFAFILGTPTPGREPYTTFNNGAFKLSSEKELTKRPRKWFGLNLISNAQFIPNSEQERVKLEDEKGNFSSKEFHEFRREAETEKNRVTWDVEQRCYIDQEQKQQFRNQISQTRLWPIEIGRTSNQPKATGGKREKSGGQDEDGIVSFHGVAYVDLSPFLYPGVKTVAGAFRIVPYNETEFLMLTSQKSQLNEAIVRCHSNTNRTLHTQYKMKAPPLQPVKQRGSSVKPVESTMETEVKDGKETPTDSQVYSDSKSYVYLEFSLIRPLIPRRQEEELAKLVSEYIPPHPMRKVSISGAEKAVQDYHTQLASVSGMILDEFRNMFGEDVLDGSLNSAADEQRSRKRELLYQLNSTGKYFAFKEQLKHSIVKIVREKFLKTSSFKTKQGLHEFLSQLYVFLIDEMHLSLTKTLCCDGQILDVVEPELSSLQLKKFAEEAEANCEYEIASKYYQDRLARNDADESSWCDYGVFNLFMEDTSKAKVCFRECIAINPDYMEGLLMYGILCSMDGKYNEAEAVFERSTYLNLDINISSSLPWVIMALFYEIHGNVIRSEHALCEAIKLHAKFKASKEQELYKRGSSPQKADSALLSTLPKMDCYTPETKRSGSLTSNGQRLSVSKPKSDKHKNEKGVSKSRSGSVSARGQQNEKTRPESPTSPGMNQSIYKLPSVLPSTGRLQSYFLRAANWLLNRKAVNFAEMALAHEIISPDGGTSAEYYLALSRLKLNQKRFAEARDSIYRSTLLDNENPDTWAFMGHLSYTCHDADTARDCYERALAFVTDASEMHIIYLRLGSIYQQEHQYSKAKNIYLLASKHSPTAISWLGVGMACYRLDEISEAEDALAEANVLNNRNALVWGYLSLVCLRTERRVEAEQCYKYAVKLDVDGDLLNEIKSLQESLGYGDPSF